MIKKISIRMSAMSCILFGFIACGGAHESKTVDTIETEAQPEEELVIVTDSAGDTLAAIAYQDPYLTENAKKEGVITTPSGLQYIMVQEGTGASPQATDEVTVHYTGMLTNGGIFDSSVQRGEPATFPLNRVIAGWTEGLQLMKEGGKAVFYIPYNLGYGAQGSGTIPPYSTLVFEVELIKVN